MAKEYGRSPDPQTTEEPEVDLDKTDRLPILEGTLYDSDVEDDAVPLDYTDVLQAAPSRAGTSHVDLPSLAESVRSVEERISRQHAEYEDLSRAFERAREAESASAARVSALAADLASARATLEAEQGRSNELERALGDRNSAVAAARLRVEDVLRESERHQGESRTLRDSLAAREATIAQVLHSLGERDAQLSALQREHAKVVPELEAAARSALHLETELQAARADVNALAADLQTSRETVTALTSRIHRGETEVRALQSELNATNTQASSYLELLRTREWRRGFDQTLFRELDARVGAASAGHQALAAQCDRLQGEVAALQATLAAQLAAADADRARWTAEMAARDDALKQAEERGAGSAQRVAQLEEAAGLRQAEQATQIAQLRAEQAEQIERLQAEAEENEQEMAVLMAHLQEARRPVQTIEAEATRLAEELAARGEELKASNAAAAELEEEHRKLRATLERTRSALEEREFLIRRLERSESNNANVLGRIQTSIERLKSVPGGQGTTAAPGADAVIPAAPAAERSAELIRIDGDKPTTHVLAKRTRIGRAAGCELQIDSGSVSRHHALVIVGPRDTIIEDLNSTNGVLVNGRKVTRHVLSDGDAVTIGETRFRYFARLNDGPPGPRPAEPSASA
jgi:pSer/pThr/pTyr-binding forkhead associated (FHA) protein/predicted  nucleic acid-binding Zn-ribbon protein